MADKFSFKQIKEFREAFNLFDRNNDGTIYEAQVVHVLSALGITTSQAFLSVSGK